MILSVLLLSMLMILCSTINVIRHLICGNNQSWFLNLNLIYETLWTGEGSGLLISMLEKLNWSHLISVITYIYIVIIVEEKTSFKMLGLTFSSKLDWDFYTISITKTPLKKIGALIRSMTFLSPEVALYLYKSTIWSCMEYCCHIWACGPSCYLELLDKLQKQICRTVGSSLAASLEPFAHH